MTGALNDVFEVKNSFVYELQKAYKEMAIVREWKEALDAGRQVKKIVVIGSSKKLEFMEEV